MPLQKVLILRKGEFVKSVLVDTNVLLRLLLKDVPEQYNQASKLFFQAKAGRVNLIIAPIVIFEISYTLNKYYGLGKSEVAKKIETLLGIHYIKIEDREIFRLAINLFKEQNLELTDCFLISRSQIEQLEIVSFDKKLMKLNSKND